MDNASWTVLTSPFLSSSGPTTLSLIFPTGTAGEGNGSPLQYCCLENPMEEEPGGLQSMGWQRVGHDLVTERQGTAQCL